MPVQAKKISNVELVKFISKVQKMQKDGMNLSEIARYFYIHRNTLRSRLKRFEVIISTIIWY